LVLHADHGGGNNSTFTTRVVTSSGSDTYSVIAAALGSLKGPKHGGANIKVSMMFDDLKAKVKDWKDEEAIAQYLGDTLDKKGFDGLGLIYGMGHAVYSLSDPRATLFKQYVERLSKDKGMEEEFALYSTVERLAPQIIGEKKRMYKGVSANVDFYSGLVYKMLNLPEELFTPIFAIARISGWCAHRLEELIGGGKIVRPAFKTVVKHREYTGLNER
jgi:citrate synthase